MSIRPWNDLTRRQQAAAVALLALAVGALAAPQVYGYTTSSDGTVAVIELDGPIDSSSAERFEADLEEARQNDSIEAVVLDVDSGGGAAAPSEQMYTAVDRTAAEMPVVATVDSMGASGAYYAMLPADEIYVAPSSSVGSVGVVGPAPTPSGPTGGTSGPDKAASHPDHDRASTELIAGNFLDSVMEQRGDRLDLTREEVAHARVYVGTEAVANGVADEIGTREDAVARAADDAGLNRYETATYESESQTQSIPLIEERSNDGDVVIVAGSGGADLNPYQPQLMAPAAWHDAFDRGGFDRTAVDRGETGEPPAGSGGTARGGVGE